MNIADNLASVQDKIASACATCGRDPASVRLIAVSKLQPTEKILAAYRAGQRDFGENYGQELRDKAAALRSESPELCWHFIGPIQSNKIRYIAPSASWVHTLARQEIADRLRKRATAEGRTVQTLVEINIAREPQKAGVEPDAVGDLIGGLNEIGVTPRGLMCMPPFDLPMEQTVAYFTQLRELAEQLAQQQLLDTPYELSMGMSDDFEQAIQQGATMVRVGTAIFGARGGQQ